VDWECVVISVCVVFGGLWGWYFWVVRPCHTAENTLAVSFDLVSGNDSYVLLFYLGTHLSMWHCVFWGKRGCWSGCVCTRGWGVGHNVLV